jgi:hypothetical protein
MTIGAAIAVGVAVGVIYTLSPLTVVFALVVAFGCRLAMRGLGARERRWVGVVLVIAIGVRVLAIAMLLVATDPAHEQFLAWFPDARYAIARSWWIRNLWFDVPIGPMYMFGIYDRYGASSFPYFLAAVQSAFGLSPYGVDLISVAALIGGALVLFRLARRAYGTAAAFSALCVVLFWPTMGAWSVSVLREAMQFFLLAVALAATVAAVRHARWEGKVLAAATAVAAVYAVSTLRFDALMIPALGIPLGLILRFATLRAWITALAVVVVVGSGLALARRPDVREFVEYQTDLAANRHLGQATSSGRSFKLLDERFYEEGPQSTFTVNRWEAMRFFARSAVAFVLVPMPWRVASFRELAIAPQQCLWYVIVVLALIGVPAAWRQDALVTALLIGVAVAGLVVIAPNSGNIGTLVRHRDMVATIVTWLAGVGFVAVGDQLARRSTERSRRLTGVASRASGWRLPGFDNQGRVFGRLNLVDVGGVLMVLLAIGLTVGTVRVFGRTPPVITAVEPSVLEHGNRRLRLRGQDFRQYFRVFLAPAGRVLVLTNPINQRSEATLRLRTSSEVELEVPVETGPGIYDLYVYDEGREVAKRSSAFTLAASDAAISRRVSVAE